MTGLAGRISQSFAAQQRSIDRAREFVASRDPDEWRHLAWMLGDYVKDDLLRLFEDVSDPAAFGAKVQAMVGNYVSRKAE